MDNNEQEAFCVHFLFNKFSVVIKFIKNFSEKFQISHLIKALLCTLITYASLTLVVSAKSIPELEHLVNVKSLTQDSKGYIWLASRQGVTRFDGKNIITFSNNNNYWPLPFSHAHNVIKTANKILISTENNGLWELDPLSGETTPINIDTQSPTIYKSLRFQNSYYAYGKSPDNLYRYNTSSSETSIIASNIQLHDLVATKKHLYFSTNDGLFQIKENEVINIIGQPVNAINSVAEGLAVATKDKLIYFADNGQTHSITINETIHAITPGSAASAPDTKTNGKTFFTINDKGKINKYQTFSLTLLTHEFPELEPQYTHTMLHDNTGVLWIISNSGIYQLIEKTLVNHSLIFDSQFDAFSLEMLNNQLIVGSYGQGLYRGNDVLKKHPTSDSTINQLTQSLPDDINTAFTKRGKIIYSMVTVDDDLYLTTFDGLWRYQSQNRQLKKVNFQGNNLILLNIVKKDNLLYIGTDSNGLLIFDIQQQKVIQQLGEGSGLSSLEVIGILPLDNGEIWITTAAGLDIYNSKARTIRNISNPTSSKVGSLILADNKIFVATMGGGIFVFNRQGELISKFASGIIFYNLKVINGEIWAPANPGLYRINPSDYQITMVPDTELLSFTSTPLQVKNTIYIPHSRGILELPLVDEKTFNAKVYISKTIVSGTNSIINKTINVDTPNDVITLEVASLDYRPGQEKQYKYRINNSNWNEVYGHQITLTGLSSGLYDIEIMGTNSVGQWSSHKAYTTINVAYPWYWTLTMRIVYAVIFLIVLTKLFWLLFMRARSIAKIHRILSTDIKNRGKAALNASRNLAYVLELLKQTDEARLEKSRSIIQQSIDELKGNVDAKEPDGLYGNSLEVALPFFSDYLQQKYHINLNNIIELNDTSLAYEMQSDVYKIIYESITSAVLNGNGRNFTMALKEVKSKLWINISDDGNSFLNFNNNINFNMAMYYTRKIAKKYNASVHIFNKQDKGSQLAISIPLMDIT
ncbi:hypothetical protein SG34_008245 [Thalassomonas viridans]|uniref:Two component regulator three Y domain-containing protein n=1 Tax=Thalassomonas viridans TaxID=137584 RepID=A0AAE9Z507_9GAMM|nr:hypothetical protein [Thalassomonas viridans]WDE06876.1 hypothetical protein SG34_008245 [Thalassomonas viridans]